MKVLNFPLIVYHEVRRYFQIGSRRQWALFFSVFIQLFSIISYTIGMKLSNYLPNEDILSILSHFTLLIHIYSLPVFIIILCYDNMIRDPSLQITAVVIIDRNKLYFTQLLSLSLFAYIIFILNSSLSFLILGLLLSEPMAILLFFKSVLLFLIICLFYTQMIIFFILLIRRFTLDEISTLIIPIIIFYILPLIINSSINYQILNPNALLISPTLWAIYLMSYFILGTFSVLESLILPITLIILIIPNLLLIKNHEFR